MTLQFSQAEHVAEMLNDLIRINTDRAIQYQKVLDQESDMGYNLQNVFVTVIRQSKDHKKELVEIARQVGAPTGSVDASGQLHRAWSDLTVKLSTNSRRSILTSCQYNEDILHHTYTAALSSDLEIFEGLRQLIEKQKRALAEVSNMIGKCREEHYLHTNSARSFQYSPMF